MSSRRTQRIADEIRAALSEVILRRMSDPRTRLAAISSVRLSPDRRHARVFVAWIGEPGGRDRVVDILNRAASFLQRELGRTASLKYVPSLRFLADDQEERAARIHGALRKIEDPGAEEP